MKRYRYKLELKDRLGQYKGVQFINANDEQQLIYIYTNNSVYSVDRINYHFKIANVKPLTKEDK